MISNGSKRANKRGNDPCPAKKEEKKSEYRKVVCALKAKN